MIIIGWAKIADERASQELANSLAANEARYNFYLIGE
jgi:hypothetical protein